MGTGPHARLENGMPFGAGFDSCAFRNWEDKSDLQQEKFRSSFAVHDSSEPADFDAGHPHILRALVTLRNALSVWKTSPSRCWRSVANRLAARAAGFESPVFRKFCVPCGGGGGMRYVLRGLCSNGHC